MTARRCVRRSPSFLGPGRHAVRKSGMLVSGDRRARALRGAALAFCAMIAPLLGAASCGPSRTNECNEVTGIVNGGLKKLEESIMPRRMRRKKRRSPTCGRWPRRWTKVAGDLSKAPRRRSPSWKGFSAKYQSLAKGVAQAARERSDAVDTNDVLKDEKARDELDKLADQEAPIVNGINDFCKGS